MSNVSFLRRSLAAWAAGLLLMTTWAHAGPPQVKTQPPGWHRVMVGDLEVTALFDGIIDIKPAELVNNMLKSEVSALTAKALQGEVVPTSVNAYLINTGTHLVLVDAGAAGLFGPGLDQLHKNLAASGYRADQVDAVVITHLHGDHIGGLVQGGQIAFPNATVYADKHDADFWLDAAAAAKAPDAMKMFYQAAQTTFAPYVSAGKFKTFEGSTEIVPGIRAIATHGHTPGHVFYTAESRGERIVFWGDLMHVAAVQFPRPEATVAFDVDNKAAAAQRKKAYADAAAQGYWVAAAHLPFPGIGRLRAEGRGYVFLPVNYVPVK